MKKFLHKSLPLLLALSLFAACGQAGTAGSAGPQHALSPNTDVRPNGQYMNEDNLLELPGLEGEVVGDGNIPAFLSSKEMQAFLDSTDIGFPDEAFHESGEYAVAVWPAEQTGLKQPGGVLARENDLIVADSAAGCLVVLSKEGVPIKTVGRLGNGEGEFFHPSAILSFNESVCVLDGGNDRIERFSEELEYEGYVQLIRPSSRYDFYDFAYDVEGNLYLSRFDGDNQRIYCYEAGKSGEPTPIGENACGVLTEKGGQVYAVNYGASYSEGPLSKNHHIFVDRGFSAGNCYLFSATQTQLTKVSELPTMMSGTSVCPYENGFLIYSESIDSVVQFSGEGEFEKTIVKLPMGTSSNSRLEAAADGTIYVTGNEDTNIYVITRKG